MAYEWMTGRRVPSAFVARDMAPLPGVDTGALGRVFARALHADPGERYESSEAFVDELEQVEVKEDEAVFVPEPPAVAAPTRRRRPPEPKPAERLPLEVVAHRADDAAEPADVLAEPEGDSSAAREVVEREVAERVDYTDQDRPVAAVGAADPLGDPGVAPEVTLFPSETPPPPAHAPGPPAAPEPDPLPAAPDPDPLPAAPVSGRLLREIHYEPPSTPQRTPSGRWRTVAGLLLGAILGIGAGYIAWGRGVTLFQRGSQESSAQAIPQRDEPPAQAAPEPSTAPAPPPPAATAPPAPAPEAPPPSASPAAAAVLDSGNLLVRSTPPGATVFVDDRPR